METQYKCLYCKKQLGKIEQLGREKPYYVCNTKGCIGQKKVWIDDGTGKLILKDSQSQRE